MSRPHAACIVEDAWHRRVYSVLRRRGWQTRIVAHTGYGEYNQRELLNRWADALDTPKDAAATVEVAGPTAGRGSAAVTR